MPVITAAPLVVSEEQRAELSRMAASSVLPHRAVVHVYPEKLTAKDTLVDGPSGKRIEIGGETTLIWVDLAPDARYAHDTEYVLITARGTQVTLRSGSAMV